MKNLKKISINKTSTINSYVSKTMVTDLSNPEIPKKLVDVLEKQRDKRGVFSENEVCTGDACIGGSSSNRSGFSVMDGEVKYKKNFDKNIVEDLKKYTDKKVVKVIQSNYLLCNFLYDLYHYPNASEEVKSLTEKICFDVRYEFLKVEDYSLVYDAKDESNTTNLLDKDLQKLEMILIKNKIKINNITGNDFDILKKYGYFVSEFAIRYKWKNNNEDYRGFLVSLDRFLDLYGDKNNKFNDGEGCGLAWGLIDMGEYKQMPELKKYGQLIYYREVDEKDINKMTVRHMLTCGLLADKLNDKKNSN
ncbi:MAG: hypothetical protein PHP97_03245 [Candidatus Shapirobacteria bacterium]|nr:hypothetical protein [Candidatus Shapirobacteria bacterium]MDD3002326.1 hypothetical protein [Candidatus Shapirobacteria bacterium]MDD4382669.1 hypothetical protein [Candidatus Shapirobacteria bacterium]